jgi:ABC-type nitrate/sulfonate/bicarbonate transport system substrate-binding protein
MVHALSGSSARFAALVAAVALILPISDARAQTKIRVGKAQAENFTFIPTNVGIAAGIFQKHGLAVEIVNFTGGARLQQGLAASGVDIGLASGPELAFIAKGAPVLAVAAIADAPFVGNIVVLKDGPVKTVDDLKGRLISVSSAGSLSEWLTRELSRRQGWGKEGIRTVGLGGMAAQAAAMKTRETDGFFAEASTAFRLEEEGVGRVVVNFGDMIKDFHIHVMYARRDFVDKQPETMRAFLAGWFETLAYMRDHRQETIAIASQAISFAPQTMARVYDLLMPAYNLTGRFNPKALEVLGNSFVETGLLRSMPDMQSLISEKFLPGSTNP